MKAIQPIQNEKQAIIQEAFPSRRLRAGGNGGYIKPSRYRRLTFTFILVPLARGWCPSPSLPLQVRRQERVQLCCIYIVVIFFKFSLERERKKNETRMKFIFHHGALRFFLFFFLNLFLVLKRKYEYKWKGKHCSPTSAVTAISSSAMFIVFLCLFVYGTLNMTIK